MRIILLSLISGIAAHGVWPVLDGLQDPELQRLASHLPDTVLWSRDNSTTKKYLGAFRRWSLWATQHNINVFPVISSHLALYLQHVAESTKSKAAAEEAVNALAWLHNAAGIPNPRQSICNHCARRPMEDVSKAHSQERTIQIGDTSRNGGGYNKAGDTV